MRFDGGPATISGTRRPVGHRMISGTQTTSANANDRRERVLEVGFRPRDLRAGVIAGALEDDPVRLHGSVVAVLDLHPASIALGEVFTPAVAALDQMGIDPADRARAAIAAHLEARKQASPYWYRSASAG